MNYFDIVLLILFAIAALRGFYKGLIIELAALIGLFLGIFIAIEFTNPISTKYFADSQHFTLITMGMFLGIFLVTILLVNLAARVVKKAINLTMLRIVDSSLGAVFALAKWVLFLSIFLWLFESMNLELPKHVTDASVFYPGLKIAAPVVFDFISSVLPMFNDVLDFMDGFEGKAKFV